MSFKKGGRDILSRRFSRNYQNGFTLIEVLLSLAITLVITTSMMSLFRLISHSHQIKSFDEDIYIGAKQVSQYLIGSYYIDLNEGYHYISRDNEDMILMYDKHRLVKKEGYEIIINNIDSLSFDIREDLLYMNLRRDKKDYCFLIGYVRERKNEDNETVEQ